MSEQDQKILKALQEAVDFGIATNQKGLRAGQTLYVDFPQNIPPLVAEAFLQKYRQAGWTRLRLYEDKSEAGKTVIELAKGGWQAFFRGLLRF